MKKRIFFAFKILILLVLTFFIIKAIELQEIIKLFRHISIWYFFLSFLIYGLDKIVVGLKWQLLLHAFNVHVPLHVPMLVNIKSTVFQFFIPSTIGVDTYKAIALKRHNAHLAHVVSSIIIERLIGGLSSLAIIALLLHFSLMPFIFPHKNIIVFCGFLGFIFLCIILHCIIKLSFSLNKITLPSIIPHFIRRWLTNFFTILSGLKGKEFNIWLYFIISTVEKLFFGTMIYLCAKALFLDNLEFTFFISAAPLLAFLERLPISFSGLGIREGAFIVLFKPFFDNVSIVISFALVYRCVEILFFMVSMTFWFGRNDNGRYDREKAFQNMKMLS